MPACVSFVDQSEHPPFPPVSFSETFQFTTGANAQPGHVSEAIWDQTQRLVLFIKNLTWVKSEF